MVNRLSYIQNTQNTQHIQSTQAGLTNSNKISPFTTLVSFAELDDPVTEMVDYAKLSSGEFMMTDGLSSCVAIAIQKESTDSQGVTTFPTTLIHANGAEITHFTKGENGDSTPRNYLNKILNSSGEYLGDLFNAELIAIGGYQGIDEDIEDFKKLNTLLDDIAGDRGVKVLTKTNMPALSGNTEYGDTEIEFKIGANFTIHTQEEG